MNPLGFSEIPTGLAFLTREGAKVDFSLREGITAILDYDRTADNYVCIGRDMMLNLAIQTAFIANKLNMGIVQYLTFQNSKEDIIREMSAIYSFSHDEEICSQRHIAFQKEFIDSGNIVVINNNEPQEDIDYENLKVAAMFLDGIGIPNLEFLLYNIIKHRSNNGGSLAPGIICPQMSCPGDDEKYYQTIRTLLEQSTAILEINPNGDIWNFKNIVNEEDFKSQDILKNFQARNSFICNLLKINNQNIEATALLEYNSLTGRTIPNATELHIVKFTPNGFAREDLYRNEGGFWEDISMPD